MTLRTSTGESDDTTPALAFFDEARLRRLFDAGVIGIVVANNAGAIIEANDAFLRMIGYSRSDLAAGLLDWRALTPPEWLPLDEAAIVELAVRGSFTPYEKEYVRRDGTRVPIWVGGARVAESDDEQICYISDLSAMHETASALRAALDLVARSERRYRELTEALPQVIMLSDSRRTLSYVNRHYTDYTGIALEDIASRWHEAIYPDDLPAVNRVRATGEPYEIEYRLRRASDGAYRWHFARALRVTDEAGEPGWLAIAFDIDDRKRAEEALRFIERASARLSESLDVQTTFETVLDLIVPAIGDWAVITVRGDDGLARNMAARHADPAKAATIARLVGIDHFRAARERGTSAALRTAQPQLNPSMTREDIELSVQPEYVPLIEELGYGSLIALPIFAQGEVVGTIGIVSLARYRYTPGDLPALAELANRAGAAIRNARRFEHEHRVASQLQAAALPQVLPDVPGLRFDTFYRAGRREAAIGGDWFDVLALPDGRVVVSVGDVAGSGLRAAVLMGNVRNVIRGAAQVDADPVMMFEIADRTLRGEREPTMITAFVGVIDPQRGEMTYASAGHLPALLRSRDGAVRELDAPGVPLGCFDLGGGERRTVALTPGSCLLLYTDGLVEWDRDIVAGERQLREAFARLRPSDAAHPARALVESVLDEGEARDDVAVLLVNVG